MQTLSNMTVLNFHFPHRFLLSKFIFIAIAERAQILFERGFLKVIVDSTLEDIEDNEFCLKTSFIFLNISNSLSTPLFSLDPEVKIFKLFSTLLLKHGSNKEIIDNILYIMSFDSRNYKMTEKSLVSFFQSGIIDSISFILKNKHEDKIEIMCNQIITHIQKIGKKEKRIFLCLFQSLFFLDTFYLLFFKIWKVSVV